MSSISTLLIVIGVISLFHAAYSAHEHSALAVKKLHHLPSTTSLPLDIKIETLTSILLTCLGLVLSSDSLKSISWSTWAGQIEKEGGGANPYRTLEDRVGFMDIRAKRQEFADWVKDDTVSPVKA